MSISPLADRILEHHRQGLHIAAIAKTIGCTRGWVGEVLLMHHIAANPKPDLFTGPVLAAHQAGLHIRGIARQVHCSHQWVGHILHRHGITSNPSPMVDNARRRRQDIRLTLGAARMCVRDLVAMTGASARVVRKDLALMGLTAAPTPRGPHPKFGDADARRQRLAMDILADPEEPAVVQSARYGVSEQTIRNDRARIQGVWTPVRRRPAASRVDQDSFSA